VGRIVGAPPESAKRSSQAKAGKWRRWLRHGVCRRFGAERIERIEYIF
jgi:hypothetical protein